MSLSHHSNGTLLWKECREDEKYEKLVGILSLMLNKEMYWLWSKSGTLLLLATTWMLLTLAGRYHATLVLNLARTQRISAVRKGFWTLPKRHIEHSRRFHGYVVVTSLYPFVWNKEEVQCTMFLRVLPSQDHDIITSPPETPSWRQTIA